MLPRTRTPFWIWFLCLTSVLGCQRQTPPSLPPTPAALPGTAALPPDVMDGGAWLLQLDPASLEATLAPERTATAIGDTYHEIGVTKALRDRGAFRVGGVRRIAPDTIGVTLSATHPFPLATRPDLSVFNLKVHVIAEGDTQFGPGLILRPDLLLNADGYSALWDSQADAVFPTVATLHPFRLLSEDVSRPASFDPFAPSGYNVWAPGATATQELVLRLPDTGTPVALRLYLTADYGQSATRATRQTPVYELPRFAGKAPWRMVIRELENNLATNDRDSWILIETDTWDWGHALGLGTDVIALTCSIPALGPPVSELIAPTDLADPLPLSFQILNERAAPEGLHWGLLTATDGAAAGPALKDDLVTPFTVSNYHTYQVFPVLVGPPTGGQPTAVISAPCENVTWWAADVEIAFSGAGSFDDETPPDLLIYEWDIDYQGLPSGFEVDRSTRDMTWTPIPGDAGLRVVALRVTDEDGLTNIATYDVRVAAVPGGPFTNRTNLTNTPDRTEDIGRAQTGFDRDHMVIDADGNVHIFTLVTFFDTEVTSFNFATQEATGPTLLYETEYLYSVPIVRTAPDGTIHLLYMAADRFNDNGYARPSIGWRTYDPVSRTASDETIIAEWFTPNPQEPTTNIPHMQGISFDIDANNQMFAVYEEWWADSVPGNELRSYAHNMFTIRGTSAGGWEDPVIVPWTTYTSRGDAFGSAGWKRARPDVRVTDDQVFHLVYLYNPDEDIDGPLPVWHRIYDFAGDSWGDARIALDDTSNRTYAQLQLFPAPGGNLVLTHQTFISNIWFQRWTKSTDTWLQPVAMADPTTNGGLIYLNLPTAAVTPDGTVFIAFQSLNSPVDLEEFYYKWFPFDATPDEIFNAPNVPLVPCIGPEGQREPQMVVDPARDRLILVYEDPEDVPANDLWLAWKPLP